MGLGDLRFGVSLSLFFFVGISHVNGEAVVGGKG